MAEDGSEANLILTRFERSDLEFMDQFILDAHHAALTGQWPACLSAADDALQFDPLCARALFQAATALHYMEHRGVAAILLEIASRVDPNRSEIWTNLGAARRPRRPEKALVAYSQAVEVGGATADAYNNMSAILSTLGQHDKAIEAARVALSIDPGHKPARANMGESQLALGNYAAGWENYAASLGLESRTKRNYAAYDMPRWNPRDHQGDSVVIYGEQGVGDELLFAHYYGAAIQAATDRGTRVIIECDARLHSLFKTAFGKKASVYGTRHESVLHWPEEEKPKWKIEAGGLGQFFEPAHGFLAPDLDEARCIRAMLQAKKDGARIIGLAWTAGDWDRGRKSRSLSIDQAFRFCARRPNDLIVSLEYLDHGAALDLAPKNLISLPHYTGKGVDFGPLAALVWACDQIHAVTTSVVDLCSAIGTACTVYVPDPEPNFRYAPKCKIHGDMIVKRPLESFV